MNSCHICRGNSGTDLLPILWAQIPSSRPVLQALSAWTACYCWAVTEITTVAASRVPHAWTDTVWRYLDVVLPTTEAWCAVILSQRSVWTLAQYKTAMDTLIDLLSPPNRAGHYILPLWFLAFCLSCFLAYYQWSQIRCLPYFCTWCDRVTLVQN